MEDDYDKWTFTQIGTYIEQGDRALDRAKTSAQM